MKSALCILALLILMPVHAHAQSYDFEGQQRALDEQRLIYEKQRLEQERFQQQEEMEAMQREMQEQKKEMEAERERHEAELREMKRENDSPVYRGEDGILRLRSNFTGR